MKNITLTIALFCTTMGVFAQDNLSSKMLTQYLYLSFVQGTVFKKSGEVVKASMDYNTLTQEMIFEQQGQHLALDQVSTVDTVYLLNDAFIPINGIFYEVAVKATASLLILYKTAVVPPGNETGFGTTQTSAANAVSDLKSSGKAYALKLPDDFKIRDETSFWLWKDGKLVSIHSTKDVQRFFADKAEAIGTYLKSNKVSFKKKDDVVKLIQFCNNQYKL